MLKERKDYIGWAERFMGFEIRLAQNSTGDNAVLFINNISV